MPPKHLPPNAPIRDERTESGSAHVDSQSELNRARRSKRVFNGLLVFVVALVVWRGLPHEVARWHYAAYENHLLEGDALAALASIERAIGWDERNPNYWLSAGSAAMDVGEYPRSWQRLDRARELLEEHYPQAKRDIARAQNAAAYARALANAELDRATADIAAALKVEPNEGAFIDTSGYIHYLQGDLETALDETHLAVTEYESNYHSLRAWALALRTTIRRREMNRQLRQLNEGMAEVYLHRGLVYQKLGKSDAAERDLAQAEFYRDKANNYAASPGDPTARAGKKSQD